MIRTIDSFADREGAREQAGGNPLLLATRRLPHCLQGRMIHSLPSPAHHLTLPFNSNANA